MRIVDDDKVREERKAALKELHEQPWISSLKDTRQIKLQYRGVDYKAKARRASK